MRLHIDRFESSFMTLSAIMIAGFGLAVLVAVFGLGVQLPGQVDQLAPAEVDSAPGFDNPGVRMVYPGKYEAYIVVQAWQFTPTEITIPAGSELTMYLASKDIIHGFHVLDTNINVMVIPGQISEVSNVFEEPGTYLYMCHEYCGALHHTMVGQIVVTEE
ncbi:MAG: cytochrome c oxidase subunit II [Anaerolineae bacterium]|nr:cytochrome c oxidase subunit II [Anaerolineae bacterium]